jgi:hypothetical protein
MKLLLGELMQVPISFLGWFLEIRSKSNFSDFTAQGLQYYFKH